MSIKYKQIAIFAIVFIILTPIGTLTHELGHVAVAKSLGATTELHYASMSYTLKEHEVFNMISENQKRFKEGKPNKNEELIHEKYRTYLIKTLLVTIGGPFQTLLTGLIGILILYIRKVRKIGILNKWDWSAVFMTMFLSRFVFNFLGFIYTKIVLKSAKEVRMDETRISLRMELPEYIVPGVLFVISTIALVYLVFYIIPKTNRINFILGGLAGSAIGWILWMNIFGPILLPRS